LTVHSLAALLALLIAGYPLLIARSTTVAALGGAALVVCVLGILGAVRVVVGGIVLALAEYALALWIRGGPPRLADAALLGVALLLLLESADFGRRAHRAALGPGVLRAQLGSWALSGALAGIVAWLATTAASAASAAVRLPWAPAVAAAGAIIALVGSGLALSARRARSRD